MIALLVLLPLLGAIGAGLLCRNVSYRFAQAMTCSLLVIAAVLSSIIFYDTVIHGHSYVFVVARWFDVGSVQANWELKVDSLTAVMLVVVTYVSALVHIYSIGYMHDDPHKQRFMSYLSLFTFFMLLLITSNNFVQLFLGWEGVGLCSYLLIGFWYHKESANIAAMKAFVVNRIGDFGFALGIFSVYLLFNSVQFDYVFPLVKNYQAEVFHILGYNIPALEITCILLFIGSMGKSAQIGLHTWLPDAMEGPTPVSALIHAATMVTAGVFLVARCSPIFEYAPIAREVVTVVGAVTCLFAALIAITQNDIKRIIAYSTCSQLGYMFFACGVSAYNAGIFHLFTHGFFKALLFLGSGSVIHAMSGEQDINKMGGIWKKLPMTYVMMWVGSLALAGIFPFAGFYSKDVIIESAYAAGTHVGKFAYWCGLIAALFTALYSWRLILKVFHGTPNYSDKVASHIHESPLSMMIPLAVLAFCSGIAGLIGEKWLSMISVDKAIFWQRAIEILPEHNPLVHIHDLPAVIKLLTYSVGIAGIVLAFIFYVLIPQIPAFFKSRLSALYNLSYHKFYFDELYDFLFVRPVKRLGELLWQNIDIKIIDDIGPNGIAGLSKKLARMVSVAQSGYLYHYAFFMLIALVGFMSWYIFSTLN